MEKVGEGVDEVRSPVAGLTAQPRSTVCDSISVVLTEIVYGVPDRRV